MLNPRAEAAIAEIENAWMPPASMSPHCHDGSFRDGLHRACEIIRRRFSEPDPLVEELKELVAGWDKCSGDKARRKPHVLAREVLVVLAKHGHGEKP